MAQHLPVTLVARGLSVDRGGHDVLHNATITITPGDRMAVVGPNGVGKSTLLLALAGRIAIRSGTVTRHPPSGRIGLLDQVLERSEVATGRALVAARIGVADARLEFEAATRALAEPADGAGGVSDGTADRYDAALTAWESVGGFDFDHRLEAACLELGLEHHHLDRTTATLSGGQLAKLGLASIMISRFDITLLDEPTNNLDRHGLAVLERWVNRHDGAILMVSHDRTFLEHTITSVARIEANGFDPASGNVEVFTGGWRDYEDQVALARRRAEERFERYTTERDRLSSLAQQKREWADRGTSRAKKRPADNDRNRRMAELDSAERQIGAAKAVSKRLERLEVVDKPWQPWQLRFTIAEAERGSSDVIVTRDLVIERGAFRLGPVTLTINFGERVLIDGANGSGKTTLVDGLLGRLEAVDGSAALGRSVITGTVGQFRQAFMTDASLLTVFGRHTEVDPTESRSLLAKFGLDAGAVARSADTLSPGQQTRAELAVFQARGVNLIVLDEPTNHLDMEAIEQLEQALADFDGTLLVVTHDQRFREALRIDRVISVADGTVTEGTVTNGTIIDGTVANGTITDRNVTPGVD